MNGLFVIDHLPNFLLHTYLSITLFWQTLQCLIAQHTVAILVNLLVEQYIKANIIWCIGEEKM